MTTYRAIVEAVAASRASTEALDADFAQLFPGRAERYPDHAHDVAAGLAREMALIGLFDSFAAAYHWVYDKIHAYLYPPQEPTP